MIFLKPIELKALPAFIRNEAKYPLLIGTSPEGGVVNACLGELGSASYLNMTIIDTFDLRHHFTMHLRDPILMVDIEKINPEVESKLIECLTGGNRTIIATCENINDVPWNIQRCFQHSIQAV